MNKKTTSNPKEVIKQNYQTNKMPEKLIDHIQIQMEYPANIQSLLKKQSNNI